MPVDNYDVVIIGAGPAGSSAAAFARQNDLRVLVVDKARFPRFRIGESLLPMGNAALRATGVWPKIVAAGFIPKHGAEFHTSDGRVVKRVNFADGLVPGLESTFQVDRAKFDTLLLDHARELGADVRLETTARDFTATETGYDVRLVDAAGESIVRTAWLLDATGRDRDAALARPHALDPARLVKRIAIYSHFTRVPRADGRDAGNILIVRIPDGWAWVIPIDAARTSVGIVTTVECSRRSGAAPAELFRQLTTASPKLSELLAAAEPTMEFRTTADYSYFRRELAHERLLLIGDAAGFLDPIFSSGVHLATSSARQAVSLLVKAHRARRGLSMSERRRYTRSIKDYAATFEKLINAFYDPRSFEVFMCQKIPWNLAPGLTSIVAGHARLTWPLWWRFHVFLFVCRIQHRWRIVDALDPAKVAPEAALCK